MKIKRVGRSLLLGMLVMLCACQQIKQQREVYIRNRAKDYTKSTVIPPLQVPADLSRVEHSQMYPLPRPLPDASHLQAVPLEPPGFGQLG